MENIEKWILEKWKSCRRTDCKINVTASRRDMIDCCVCTGHTNKKKYGRKRYNGYDYGQKSDPR